MVVAISFIAVACSLAPVACCCEAACSSADELSMSPTAAPSWRVSPVTMSIPASATRITPITVPAMMVVLALPDAWSTSWAFRSRISR